MATEILKQAQHQPLSLEDEVVILFACNAGLTDDIPLDRCGAFEEQLLRYVSTAHSDITERIRDTQDITEETETQLTQVINDFKGTFS